MKIEEKLTILISSCEAYSDLWDNHVKLLNENWKNRKIDAVIVTDKEHLCSYPNVRVFPAGEFVEMPQRIKKFADNCNSEYLLITLDDYYVDKRIDNKKLEHAIELMEKYKLDYLRFWPFPHEKNKVKGEKKVYWIELEGNYKVNLYPAIWRKSFLEATVKKPLNAWQYEVSLTQIAKELNAKCAYSMNGEFHIVDVIRKGKLLHPAKKFLDSKGLYLNRDLISRKEEIILTIRYYGKEIVPKPILRFVKKQLVKRGIKFYSDGI